MASFYNTPLKKEEEPVSKDVFKTPDIKTDIDPQLLNAPKKGELVKDIRTIFKEVTNLKLIGAKSANGFIMKVKGKQENVSDTANHIEPGADKIEAEYIIKSARNESATQQRIDNPAYEFVAGFYINTQIPYFPCFLRTDELLKYDDSIVKRQTEKTAKNQLLLDARNIKIKNKNMSQGLTVINPNEYGKFTDEACRNKNEFAILMEYFDGFTLQSMLESTSPEKTLSEKEKSQILFQIYAPLYALGKNNFRHKDLHANNVMVKTLDNPITFEYIFDDVDIVDQNGKKITKVTFETRYLAKMIDYGRCHVPFSQKYLEKYYSTFDDRKLKNAYEQLLNECGMIHILFDYSDLNLYKKVMGKDLRSVEFILNTLIPEINNKSLQSAGSKRKSKKMKKKIKKKSRKIKGGGVDGTLIIDCVNYEKDSDTEKPPHTRKQMGYNGNNEHIIEMANSPEPVNKKLFGSGKSPP